MQKSAILFGATGLIGGQLLGLLLENPAYDRVTAVVRRDVSSRFSQNPKLTILHADLQTLNDIKAQLIGDDIFCCLGTTRKKTPDLNTYYAVDHDYPVTAASWTKANGAKTFLLVSAIGANANSGNFYLRMKGETERDVEAVGFERLHIFRPSLLAGNRSEHRWMESLSSDLFKVLNPLLTGKRKRYRSIPAVDVAKAMNSAAQQPVSGTRIYYWNDIKDLA